MYRTKNNIIDNNVRAQLKEIIFEYHLFHLHITIGKLKKIAKILMREEQNGKSLASKRLWEKWRFNGEGLCKPRE